MVVGGGYKKVDPEEQPKVTVEMQVDKEAYEQTEVECRLGKQWTTKNGKLLTPPKTMLSLAMTADSGAQVDCINKSKLRQLGLSQDSLLATSVKLGCANETSAGVLGVFFAKIEAKSAAGRKTVVRCLVYVLETGGNLLSRSTLEKLGLLPTGWPDKFNRSPNDAIYKLNEVLKDGAVPAQQTGSGGATRQPPGQCDPDSDLPCCCPRRQYTDPPDILPMPAINANRSKLEDWIRNHYASSAFNVCKRQAMPRTSGPVMNIFTQPGAVPVVVHKPSPVPLHWRAQVKADLDSDVIRGVLEKVPSGTPDTWCAWLVLQPKKNGTARRTIDLSALTKVGIRETHHTRSPFKVVCTVPRNTLKSTLDCVDGYHGVEIAEEDRHKTTFITEWGRYRYIRIPQGYGASNDGYTKRTDDILDSVPDKPEIQDMEKIVDDIIQWSDDLESAFFRICNLLSHCSRSGMVFSPQKFQFAQEEVEYAGFVVGKTGIRPTDHYKQAILDFPPPTNISEIRSWFGLIHQVAYCFSTSPVMAPFRHLLKPSTKFAWDPELQDAFTASKREILRLVDEGVSSFDPALPTCISPDWCHTGIGWILQQKTCNCEPITPVCCKTGWRLVLAGGRFTIPAESRYSPTEGEALSCADALESSKYYTLGCPQLYIATDHMPLLGILCDRALDTIANPRLVRIKERTLWWQFKMIYVPGKKQTAADALSRRKLPAALHRLSVSKIEQTSSLEDSLKEDVTLSLEELTADSLNTSSLDAHLRQTFSIASVKTLPAIITWKMLVSSTQEDPVLVKLTEQIGQGFPDSQFDVDPTIRSFHRYRHGLNVVNGAVCFKTRLIIPAKLQQTILTAIHSAHQGVSGMNNRVEQAVFWPGLTTDIVATRQNCLTCMKNAPSQPAEIPVRPPSPEYPFQLIVADYFSLQGHNYLVVADRFSGWFSVYETGKGEFDAKTLVKYFREHFLIFGIPEECASDMGPQLMAKEVGDFFSTWDVHHRSSSSYFPHSNCRAELAVKTAKRLLRDNMDSKGGINTDRFLRAALQYRNTPQQDTRLSPAQIVFGRQLRDCIPVLPFKYEPRQEWGLMQEYRERAMAKRLDADGERLARHTKTYRELPVGTAVSVQNQTGLAPKKWDKTGVIMENMPHSKVLVKMDGSRRVTVRNRRFVREIISSHRSQLPPVIPPITPPFQSQREICHPVNPPLSTVDQEVAAGEVGQNTTEEIDTGAALSQENSASSDENRSTYAPIVENDDEIYTFEAPVNDVPASDVPAGRPRRERKPNSKYDPKVYDLDELYVPLKLALEVVKVAASPGSGFINWVRGGGDT